MRAVWIEDAELRPFGGHGVDFFADNSELPASLIAVVRGFDWYHEAPDVVEVRIRPVDAAYGADFLAAARLVIEQYLVDRGPMHGQLTQIAPSLFAHING